MIILKTDGQSKKTSQFEDIFFFDLFHEIGHILLHSKKKVFLDLEDKIESREEKEADAFATRILMPELKREDLEEYKNGDSVSAKKTISRLSKRYSISESIVAGKLEHQFKGLRGDVYHILNEYRTIVKYSNYLD